MCVVQESVVFFSSSMTNIMIFQDVPVDMGASAMSTSSKHTGPGKSLISKVYTYTHILLAPQPILLEAVPLTAEAFAPYGQVIAFDDHQTVSANQGTARRLNYAASLTNLRPTSSHISPAARPNLALFRCVPLTTRSLQVKLLERHRWSTQMFMPVASTPDAVGYLVVVAQNGPGKRTRTHTIIDPVVHSRHR
jgi:ureidoglycolate hydrolase